MLRSAFYSVLAGCCFSSTTRAPLTLVHPDHLVSVTSQWNADDIAIPRPTVFESPVSGDGTWTEADDIAEYFAVDAYLFHSWRDIQEGSLYEGTDTTEFLLEEVDPVLNRAFFGYKGVDRVVATSGHSSTAMRDALRRALYLMEIASDSGLLDSLAHVATPNHMANRRIRPLTHAQIEASIAFAFTEKIARCSYIFTLLRTIASDNGVPVSALAFQLGCVALRNDLKWFSLISDE